MFVSIIEIKYFTIVRFSFADISETNFFGFFEVKDIMERINH